MSTKNRGDPMQRIGNTITTGGIITSHEAALLWD